MASLEGSPPPPSAYGNLSNSTGRKSMPRKSSRRSLPRLKSKRLSQLRRSKSRKALNPLFESKAKLAEEIKDDEVSHSGYLKVKQKLQWKTYWFVLHGSRLTSFKMKPESSKEAVTMVVDTIDFDRIKEIKVENLALILKLKSKKDSAGKKLVRTLNQKSRAQQFLRAGSSNMYTLWADDKKEAQDWVYALQNVSALKKNKKQDMETLDAAIEAEMPLEEVPEVKRRKEYQLSKIKIKNAENENEVLYRGHNITTTITGLSMGKASHRIAVKHLIGPLPTEGFIITAELSEIDGTFVSSGQSRILHAEDFIEYDEEKHRYDDSINLTFRTDDNYHVYIEMERENLSVVSKDIQTAVESELLTFLLQHDVKLIYAGLFIVIQLFLQVITRSALSGLLTLSFVTAFHLSGVIPHVKGVLLDKLQPYFLSSVSIRSQDDLNSPDNAQSDLSITKHEYLLIEQLRQASQNLFDAYSPDSTEYQILDKHINTDYRLVRYLRARNNNVVKAAKMLNNAMKWRLGYLADEVIDENVVPEWLLEYAGCSQFTELVNDRSLDRLPWWLRDKDHGNLAVLAANGGLNWRKVLKKCNNDPALLFHYGVWVLELVQQDLDRHHEESNGEFNSYLTAVVDLKGFSFSKQIPFPTLVKMAKKYLPTILLCYPEILNRVCIINAPTVFYTFWNAIVPLLPDRIIRKIQIHGPSDNLKYISRLLDLNEVPVSYGGNMVINGDPTCRDRCPCAGPFMEDKGESLIN